MPARRRHYPGRGPAPGISGTRGAYDTCARPGCGHARVKHLTAGPCVTPVHQVTLPRSTAGAGPWGICQCPAFTESEK